MSNRYISLLLGLTSIATATIVPSLPVHAATCETGELFDFDSINFIDTRPLDSNNCLRLFGERVGENDPNPQGFVAYGFGYIEMSRNSPGNPAPKYAAGIDFSPENLPGARRSASLLDDVTGFSNFTNFLIDNDISFDRIGFSFGPKDGDFTKALNLGDTPINGQNYFSSPDSTLEERIYSANPDDIETFLLLDDTKIINFGYSNIYSFLEYGETTAADDDSEAIISDPFSVSKAEGISGLSDGLADAFLADVDNDKIQLVSEDAGVVPDFVAFSDPIGSFDPNPIVSIRFPAQLRVVNVPEPSIMFSLLGLSVIAVSSRSNKKNRSHH